MARSRRAPATGRLLPPVPSIADFHVHTTRSDGVLEPAALVAAAAEAGVRHLAVTDHDTLAGYAELVGPGAPPLPPGLELIPGVEINAVAHGLRDLPDGELHVVGLGVDPGDPGLAAALAAQRGHRRARFDAMTDRLRAGGWDVTAQLARMDLGRHDALGRPTLARALVAAGHAASVQDAFSTLVGQGCPGYVPRHGLDPFEAVAVITGAGGLAVLAHFAAAPEHVALLRDLMAAGLGGLETNHRSFRADVVDAVTATAAELALVPSGGTDYHGDEEAYAAAIGETWVPDVVVAAVRAALAERGRLPGADAARGTGAADHSARARGIPVGELS